MASVRLGPVGTGDHVFAGGPAGLRRADTAAGRSFVAAASARRPAVIASIYGAGGLRVGLLTARGLLQLGCSAAHADAVDDYATRFASMAHVHRRGTKCADRLVRHTSGDVGRAGCSPASRRLHCAVSCRCTPGLPTASRFMACVSGNRLVAQQAAAEQCGWSEPARHGVSRGDIAYYVEVLRNLFQTGG